MPNKRNDGGLLIIDSPDAARKELPTFTCCHCQRVVVMHPERKRVRNWCPNCDHYTCDSGGCIVECNPIKRDIERAFASKDDQPWLQRDNGFSVRKIDNMIIRRRDIA